MMMALAGCRDRPGVLVPGGVMLPAEGAEDTAAVQTLGARFAHGLVSLEEAAALGCRACGSPGGGCHFFGTAATSQVVGEALGLSLPHSALAPSGQPVWLEAARQSARAVLAQETRGLTVGHVLTDARRAQRDGRPRGLRRFDEPAAAPAGRRPRRGPAPADGRGLGRARAARCPRLVSVLPNGPVHHPTVRVFLAGGVPEVMLHLRRLGLLDTSTASPRSAGRSATCSTSGRDPSGERRFRALLRERDGVDPATVIHDPDSARRAGLTGTVAFPVGNLAPAGRGGEGHRHRSVARRTPTASTA